MTKLAQKLLREALGLTQEERAAVAAGLLASLDEAEEPETDVESAWAEEIQVRAQRVLSGEAEGKPWSELYSVLESGLSQKK